MPKIGLSEVARAASRTWPTRSVRSFGSPGPLPITMPSTCARIVEPVGMPGTRTHGRAAGEQRANDVVLGADVDQHDARARRRRSVTGAAGATDGRRRASCRPRRPPLRASSSAQAARKEPSAHGAVLAQTLRVSVRVSMPVTAGNVLAGEPAAQRTHGLAVTECGRRSSGRRGPAPGCAPTRKGDRGCPVARGVGTP